jgi:hypothetical protein
VCGIEAGFSTMTRRFFQRSFPLSMGVLAILSLAGWIRTASPATYEIFPSTAKCDEEFENVANTLQPGDELVLHGGTYSQRCRRAITVSGTAAAPILIRAADGESPLLTRPAENRDTHNNIEIVNSSYLILRGLRFQGGNTGVRFIGGHHITIEDCEIFDTGNNAITLNSGDSDAFTIRRNHIHHTGLSASGPTEGEGLYLGCNNHACRVTNSLIDGNYIHHLRATSDGGNDGIEVKPGSYGNIIRNNVIHNTNIGTEFPCIFVYGGGNGINIVEGNAMWNCGEGIQVVSDAIVRNNLILNSSVAGITSGPHRQVAGVRNVTIVNNTIYGHPECLHLRWVGARNMLLVNNAVYCPGGIAANTSGLAGRNITVRSNYFEGRLLGVPPDTAGFISGGSASSVFRDPQQFDFWPAPTSVLIGNAEATLTPPLDFNEQRRLSPYDVGAYQTDGLGVNPGWRVGPAPKAIR